MSRPYPYSGLVDMRSNEKVSSIKIATVNSHLNFSKGLSEEKESRAMKTRLARMSDMITKPAVSGCRSPVSWSNPNRNISTLTMASSHRRS